MKHLRDQRSLLFVPGHRRDRFAKAMASGADCVCIDLEDAVAPIDREAARADVAAFLAEQSPGHAYGLRINALGNADGAADLALLRTMGPMGTRPAFVMLAKTESAGELQALAAASPGTPQIALIETAAALFAAPAIAQAQTPLQALMLGGADLSAELGCDFAWEPLLFARGQLVAAAATAQLGCIDVPFLDITDADACRAEAARVAALGFSAKALIHPSQAAPVHAGFAPTPAALAHAQRVVEATTSGGGALLVDGRMVDRPVLLAAERTLRRAGAA